MWSPFKSGAERARDRLTPEVARHYEEIERLIEEDPGGWKRDTAAEERFSKEAMIPTIHEIYTYGNEGETQYSVLRSFPIVYAQNDYGAYVTGEDGERMGLVSQKTWKLAKHVFKNAQTAHNTVREADTLDALRDTPLPATVEREG